MLDRKKKLKGKGHLECIIYLILLEWSNEDIRDIYNHKRYEKHTQRFQSVSINTKHM
jgi:hypothetical protein